MLRSLNERIRLLDAAITRRAKANEMARRLMTIPGIGPVTATALVALAPPAHHRGERRGALVGSQGRGSGIVAGADDGAQAAPAGHCGPRQQDGSHHLGVDGEGRHRPSSDRRSVSPLAVRGLSSA